MSKMIPDNLVVVQDRIHKALQQAGRKPDSARLLAVSKTKPCEDIRAAYSAGQRCFGENYLQEALEKQQQLNDLDIEWHYIGPIQSNKTRAIAEHFDWVHSVDREKVARRLSEQRPADLPALNICLQINVDNEDTKAGITLAELPKLYHAIKALPNLHIRGLMAIPAPSQDVSQQRATFAKVQQALAQLDSDMDTLSMGMSGDLESAIAAGSTIVRIGTDIFGARN
ncbi:MAG: YggS family pyridoxal phosphate-dependent enzyme [Candidatus Pelagadaptatus aseana]|uniref:YggS family pyridoxal phosphate-dependent enzyme n=1 Tax=Candidatus Pelagadaptatus aseana TaxID=3120508 RepID=UPI0039B33F12